MKCTCTDSGELCIACRINEDIVKEYFESLSKEELVTVAFELSNDCGRLRKELDDLNGVIR